MFSKVNPAGEAREYGLLEITADAYRLLDDDTKPAAIRAAWGDVRSSSSSFSSFYFFLFGDVDGRSQGGATTGLDARFSN